MTPHEAALHGYATAISSGNPPAWGPGVEDTTQLSWPHALIDACAARTDPAELRDHMAMLEQVQDRCHISRVQLRFLRQVASRSRPARPPQQ